MYFLGYQKDRINIGDRIRQFIKINNNNKNRHYKLYKIIYKELVYLINVLIIVLIIYNNIEVLFLWEWKLVMIYKIGIVRLLEVGVKLQEIL